MKLLLTLAALAALALAGCWGQDNPLDPGRCDPACGAGFHCGDGRCVALDGLGAGDGARPQDRGPRDGAKLPDKQIKRDKAKPMDKGKPQDLAKPMDKGKPLDLAKPLDKGKPPDKPVLDLVTPPPDTPPPPLDVIAGSACADKTVEQTFKQGMAGCAGKVTFVKRLTLCGAGYRVCTAMEWASRFENKAPKYSYWTNDKLRYMGTSTYCYATTSGGNAYWPGQPMRVCAGTKDPLGNTCNWVNCGLNKPTPKLHFGGCNDNPTAGAICCPK